MTDAEDPKPRRSVDPAPSEVHRESRHTIYRAKRAADDDATRLHPQIAGGSHAPDNIFRTNGFGSATPGPGSPPSAAHTTATPPDAAATHPHPRPAALPSAPANSTPEPGWFTKLVGIAVPAYLVLAVAWCATAVAVNQGFFSLTRTHIVVLVVSMVLASLLWVVVMWSSLRRRTMRRSVMLTALSTLVPGLGLGGAKQPVARIVGTFMAAVSIATVVFGIGYTVSNFRVVAGLAVNQNVLTFARVALIALALIWVVTITVTHLLTRPNRLSTSHKGIGAAVVAFLCFCVAAPLSVGAQYTLSAGQLVNSVFSNEDDVNASSRPTLDMNDDDPWRSMPRLNIMLLGADDSEARDYDAQGLGIRTDTIIIASIDTASGNTILVQIPRNLQYTPFPPGSEMAQYFPDGYTGEGDSAEWFFNTIWERVERDYPDLMAGQTYRGAEALKQGAEGITGLKIDYFMMLDLDGLRTLIDAMGGVTVNINQVLPMGSHTRCTPTKLCLEPGPNQHLDGTRALWYGRSRSTTSDYDRMARQSCLVDAIIKQANPATMLRSFEGIAAASAKMVVTDIPEEVLQPLVDLSLRVKDAQVSRVVFQPGVNGYSFEDPDFVAMRRAVARAITPATATPSATAPATPSPSETDIETPEVSPSASPSNTGGAQVVADACAYHPEDEPR